MQREFKCGIFWLSVFMMAVMFCFYNIAPVYADNELYSDMPSQHPEFPYVKYLMQHDIIYGFEDGSFRPGRDISRAEMASLLVRAAGLDTSQASSETAFKDLNTEHWAFKSIDTARQAGLVKGYTDGSFRPEDPVSRAETCAFLFRLSTEALPEAAIPSAIQDVEAAHWAKPVIAAAMDAGIMKPAAEKSFAPEKSASRLEVCRGLALLLNLIPEKAQAPLTGSMIPVKGEVFVYEGSEQPQKVLKAAACSAGMTIKTGDKSEAEIRYPDGSGLKLAENTEIHIVSSTAWARLSQEGNAANLLDYLEVKLLKGRIFGVLATNYLLQEEKADANQKMQAKKIFSHERLTASLQPIMVSTSGGAGEQQLPPWYKQQYAKKVRVKVDMPFGVASVRGTIWMNEVKGNSQTTSVANGQVEVSSGGQSVDVQAGRSVDQTSAQSAPPPSKVLGDVEKQLWDGVHSWIEERARAIEQLRSLLSQAAMGEPLAKSTLGQDILNSVKQATRGGSMAPAIGNSASGGSGGSGSGDSDSSSPSPIPGYDKALKILQNLEALVSGGLNSQAEIDTARNTLEEARIAVEDLENCAKKNELLNRLSNCQTAINEAQAALISANEDNDAASGTWSLVKSFEQTLTSDFSIKTINNPHNPTHFALFTSNGDQIDSRKALNDKVRGLSLIFSQLSNLQLRFYNSADAADPIAAASLTGTYSDGQGIGILEFFEEGVR